MALWLFLAYSIPISCTSVRPCGLGVFLPAESSHQAQSAIQFSPRKSHPRSDLVTFSPPSPPLARALAERNYDRPTPVQTAVLADEAAGRDLLVSAQTGSGKTVAYGLAVAKELLDSAARFGQAAAPLALIVAPTREL